MTIETDQIITYQDLIDSVLENILYKPLNVGADLIPANFKNGFVFTKRVKVHRRQGYPICTGQGGGYCEEWDAYYDANFRVSMDTSLIPEIVSREYVKNQYIQFLYHFVHKVLFFYYLF